MLLPLTACSGTDATASGVNRTHGIPIRVGEVHGPGTPLLDGFTVPSGAVLAGAVLQSNEKTGGPDPMPIRTWSATLGIDGPPLDVVHAFADQARSAGLETYGDGGCFEAQARPPTPAGCALSTTNSSPATGPPGPQFGVTIQVVPGQEAIGYVQFREWGEPGQFAPPTSSSTLPVPPRFAPEPSVSLPAFRGPAEGTIPETGEPIGFAIVKVRVQPGSAMVVPLYGAPPNSSENEALIRVTDDEPNTVFRSYLRALKAQMPRQRSQPNNESAGWTVRTVYVNDRGEDGNGGTAQLFTRPGRAYIRIYLYQG
jgi:hypothetical protein